MLHWQLTRYEPIREDEFLTVFGVSSAEAELTPRLIEQINGKPAIEHPASQYLIEHGFASSAMGLQLRPVRPPREHVETEELKADG